MPDPIFSAAWNSTFGFLLGDSAWNSKGRNIRGPLTISEGERRSPMCTSVIEEKRHSVRRMASGWSASTNRTT